MDDKKTCIVCKRILIKSRRIPICYNCRYYIKNAGLTLTAVAAFIIHNRDKIASGYDAFSTELMKEIVAMSKKK